MKFSRERERCGLFGLVVAFALVACGLGLLAACAANGGELVVMGSGEPMTKLTVMGRAFEESTATAEVDSRPVVLVYSRDLPRDNEFRTSCRACFDLWSYERTHKLPFRLEWRKPEPWVTAVPTLHFQDGAGQWWKREGFSGPESFRGICE